MNKRNYPWRKSRNPFHILVAEFMLQQTHVRAVPEVYSKFIENYPDPYILAEEDLGILKQYFLPLGLTYRAERLKRSAELICGDFRGTLPSSRKDLMTLPGVGDYIADAVLCYGFGKPTVPIDTNVIRLFCRFFGFSSSRSRPRTDPVLAQQIRTLYRNLKNTRDANLAVLDFAAAVCTAKKPMCESCPLLVGCVKAQDYFIRS